MTSRLSRTGGAAFFCERDIGSLRTMEDPRQQAGREDRRPKTPACRLAGRTDDVVRCLLFVVRYSLIVVCSGSQFYDSPILQFYSRHGGQGSPLLRCTFYVLWLWTILIDKQRSHLQRPIRVNNQGFRTPEGFKMYSPGWFIRRRRKPGGNQRTSAQPWRG